MAQQVRGSWLIGGGLAGIVAGVPVMLLVRNWLFGVPDEGRLITALYLVACCGAIFAGFLQRRLTLRIPFAYLSLIPFFLALWLINWHFWPKGTALDYLMPVYSFFYVIIPLLVTTQIRVADIERMFSILVVFGCIMAGAVGLYYFTQDTALFISIHGARLDVSPDLNPISQAATIAIAIIMLLPLLLVREKGKTNTHLWIILGALIFAMLLAGARGPTISFGVTSFAVAIFAKQYFFRRVRLFLPVIALGLVLAVSFALLPTGILARFIDPDLLLGDRVGAYVRVSIMRHALVHWQESPFLGSGLSGNAEIGHAHNLFVQLLMEVGLVGATVFVIMLAIGAVRFFKRCRSFPLPIVSMRFVGLAVFTFVQAQISGTYMAYGLLWMCLGLSLNWPRLAQKHRLEIDVT